MPFTLENIERQVAEFDVENSLLFLNHLLTVSRKMASNPPLESQLDELGYPLPPHIVHLVAKVLVNHSRAEERPLNWPVFREIMRQLIDLDDPICLDPTFKEKNPAGFFERFLGLQISAQRRNVIQKYGLVLALFRDIGFVDRPHHFDLRSVVENELQMSVDEFVSLGHFALTRNRASYFNCKCLGTFTRDHLLEAGDLGIRCCTPDNVDQLIRRFTSTPTQFQRVSQQDPYKANGGLFRQFEFNALKRFPVIQVRPGFFIAPDPELIAERATYGIFYDLFEAHGPSFVESFGYCFEKLIGQMLKSIVPAMQLWSSEEFESSNDELNKPRSKNVDWVFLGRTHNILFECKSLRPSLPLLTYGGESHIDELVRRLVSALKQLVEHQNSISQGEWVHRGIEPKKPLFVITTFGKFETVNGPFLRKKVAEAYEDLARIDVPYVVLSLEEVDWVVSLLERNHDLENVIERVSKRESFNPFHEFSDQLSERAASRFVLDKGEDLFASIAAGLE